MLSCIFKKKFSGKKYVMDQKWKLLIFRDLHLNFEKKSRNWLDTKSVISPTGYCPKFLSNNFQKYKQLNSCHNLKINQQNYQVIPI